MGRSFRLGSPTLRLPVMRPALKGFWVQALLNHPGFEDEIESYDIPVNVKEMAGCKIQWKAGQDVTMGKVQKGLETLPLYRC
eukprot:g22327.t1